MSKDIKTSFSIIIYFLKKKFFLRFWVMFILKNFLLYRRLVENQYRWDQLQSKNFIYI
jgi:hypothetical protein